MPPIDLSALKTAQTETARVRLALTKAEAKLNETRAQLRLAQSEFDASQQAGDIAAATRAKRTVDRATAVIDESVLARGDLAGALRERIDEVLRLEMDAPAEVPLLLMPVRLETRYGSDAAGSPILRIRIYPDDIHLDLTDPGLSDDELAAARAYWSALFAAPDDANIAKAWADLGAVVGRNRQRLVALAQYPANPEARGTGAAPMFLKAKAPHKSAARPRLLPDIFRVTAIVKERKLRAQGQRVDHDLKVGLLADDGSKMIDKDGLKLLEGTEWLADYELALAAGMAIDLPLPTANLPIDSLYVYGICQSRKPAEAAAELAALFEAHDTGPGLGFVPQGTATNNTEAGVSGWQRWLDPAPCPLAPVNLPADANASVLAAALGLETAVFSGAAHAADREQGAARAMNAALWPATWGYFLETLDQTNQTLDPWLVEDLRQFNQEHVRGRGVMPALAVGDQPYGVLNFAGFGRRFKPLDAGATEQGLESFLRKALPNWLNAVPDLPQINGDGRAEKVLEIFGQAPVSWGVRARKCLGSDLLKKISTTTAQASDAADVEALLTQLLAESLGGFSYTFGAGSLAADSRPVALPYADPARDAGYAAALIEGRAPGSISSLFQALIDLGYKRLLKAATPSPKTPDALRATDVLNTRLTEQVIGLVMAAQPASARDYETLLQTITAIAPEGHSLASAKFQPVTLVRDDAARTLQATSVLERNRLGFALANQLLRAQMQLAEMVSGLQTLIALAAMPESANFTTLVAETVDSASHRLDAWISGLSSARLQRMRAATPAGISVGAYGWLFDLAPQNRAKPQGGFIAAPGLDLATTAGLLRSGYLAHNPADGTGGAFAIDLSSARVRRALSLLEGVANGQELGALLGYEFERRLHAGNCDRFILSFRGLAPLKSGKLTDAGAPSNDAESQALAAANVTDMLQLLKMWQAQGSDVILNKLKQRPAGNEYLDAAVDWTGPDAPQKAAIRAAVAEAGVDADAIADLLLAESVHQLAQGNMARASAALDAGGKGEAPPPAAPDVIQTSGPGTIVTHRLIVLLPKQGGWSNASPRAMTSAGLEAWVAHRLPPPNRVVLGQALAGGLATLADTGLSALDFAALCRHPGVAERVVISRAPLANPEVALLQPGSNQIPADRLALSEAMLTGAALQELLENARPLNGLNIGLPGTSSWAPEPGAMTEAATALTTAAGVLQARLLALQNLLAGANVARADLMAALLGLTDFGIVMPDLTEAQVADLAHLALEEAGSRLHRLQDMLPIATPDSVEAAATVLFGPGFLLPLAHVFAPDDPAEPLGERATAALRPGLIERYLADCGSVRPAVGRYQRLNLLASISGQRPALQVLQLCSQGDDPPDVWIGAGLPADQPSPACAIVSLLADAPEGLNLDQQPVAGLLIDNWTETMARRARMGVDGPVTSTTTAGVALHADAPGAEPPQSLILALSPDGSRWTEDSLCDLLSDVLDLAKVRLVTLETLPLAARVLPAIYTNSWSLQGEDVIDWSKILTNVHTLASTDGLKNFTMTRET